MLTPNPKQASGGHFLRLWGSKTTEGTAGEFAETFSLLEGNARWMTIKQTKVWELDLLPNRAACWWTEQHGQF